MQIVRVLTTDGEIRHGWRDGETIRRLDGDVFDNPQRADEPLKVSRLLAPVAPPTIFAVGLNYRAHAAESGSEIPAEPVIFAKAVTSLNDPGGAIVIPSGSDRVDYECELAVVIGQRGRNLSERDALGVVLGYTCGNDVSERYWQRRLGQWVRAKSYDTFCPLGPWIETQIDNPNDLALSTRLNGQLMQDGNTSDMIFTVAQIISFLSQDLTLLPGTVILTGTPPGVGFARTPAVWLRPGDQVTVEVERIGALTNPVASAAPRR